jgi:hypothetical protein
MSPERHGHADRHEGEDHVPGGGREAPEDVCRRHQAGQDESERQEHHHDVVGEHVGDEQGHRGDDGAERDEPAALEPLRQGQDPSQHEEDDRREGAQRAHGGELAGEPAEQGGCALAASRPCRLPGRRHPVGEPRPQRAEPGPQGWRSLADRREPAVEVPGGRTLEQARLVSAEEVLGILYRARRQREIRGGDDVAGRRQLLGRRAQPGRIRLADLGAGDGQEGRVDDQVRALRTQQARLVDELGQGRPVSGFRAGPPQDLGAPARPDRHAGH